MATYLKWVTTCSENNERATIQKPKSSNEEDGRNKKMANECVVEEDWDRRPGEGYKSHSEAPTLRQVFSVERDDEDHEGAKSGTAEMGVGAGEPVRQCDCQLQAITEVKGRSGGGHVAFTMSTDTSLGQHPNTSDEENNTSGQVILSQQEFDTYALTRPGTADVVPYDSFPVDLEKIAYHLHI